MTLFSNRPGSLRRSSGLRFLCILLLVGMLSGCAAVRYETPSLVHAPTSNTIVTRYFRFAWGLVPGSPISLEQCGVGGIKKMKVRPNFIDSLITTLTGGFVAPVRVKFTCAAAPAPVAGTSSDSR